MGKKKIRFLIRVTENVGGRRRILSSAFKTRSAAKKEVKKILAPAKKRKLPSGKVITLTSFRDAQSGAGLVNPRVIRRKLHR